LLPPLLLLLLLLLSTVTFATSKSTSKMTNR
jgi:hypothetical protein